MSNDWGDFPTESLGLILKDKAEYLKINLDDLHGEISSLLIQIKLDIKLKNTSSMSQFLEELSRIGGFQN